MRIEGLNRPVAGGGGPRPAGSGFRLAEASPEPKPNAASAARPAPATHALIALQTETDSPRERRRREVRRGRALLDALDAIRLALVEGRADHAALASLAHSVAAASGGSGDPGLDDALSAIDLRARVELAKRGA